MTCIDSSTQIVEAIWPLSSVVCRSELGTRAVLPLRTFIQETLRRSRTSYSTLQVALYYLILIKPHVPTHNFTTEQPHDRYSDRALQCGRRMFLAALILASKYLQDRNYTARAWSKISGLNTQEIHENEISFLLAVNWKLHITDAVFQRWTELVLKYTPTPCPLSPGSTSPRMVQQNADWKQFILRLDPDLTNIEGYASLGLAGAQYSDLKLSSPRSILNHPPEPRQSESTDATPTPRSYVVPMLMETQSKVSCVNSRFTPSLGALTTPRFTPQLGGSNTPAASAASQMLGRTNAMGLAMAQANTINTAQYMDRTLTSATSSPQNFCPLRRSSLANSVSTASSPESMVSDSSRSSRSSSISSASGFASATLNCKLSAMSRFRGAKLCNERMTTMSLITSVPEDFSECTFSSPDSYTGSIGKLGDTSMDNTFSLQANLTTSITQAPVLQQDLCYRLGEDNKTGYKRSRSSSVDESLQDNVRQMLGGNHPVYEPQWTDALSRSRGYTSEPQLRVAVQSNTVRSSKRICCSSEAATGYAKTYANVSTLERGPGMWQGILN